MFKYCVIAICLVAAVAAQGPKMLDEPLRWSECKDANQSIYDFKVETLDGKTESLSKYKGQTLLIINVATFCHYTEQYLDFIPLIEETLQNSNSNFTILAFPCNQFYLQEPAENHEILNGIKYGSCPQTVPEIGKKEDFMYNLIRQNDITWNFEKFLVDKNGNPRFRFHPTAWSKGKVVQPFIKQLMEEN
uniref:Glutathione peroxidase n=1 Tax=Panagrolaimus sp. PS1159 TaxID=55785 RepID=A0AC35GGV2_9BILA